MARKQTRAGTVVEAAIDSIEEATVAVGSKVQHGLSDAATAVAKSTIVERVEKQAKTSRKAIAKNVAKAKKVAKKHVAKATKKMAATKKAAKKRVTKATKKAPAAKKQVAKRRRRPRRPRSRPWPRRPRANKKAPTTKKRPWPRRPGCEEASSQDEDAGRSSQEGLSNQVADSAALIASRRTGQDCLPRADDRTVNQMGQLMLARRIERMRTPLRPGVEARSGTRTTLQEEGRR